MSVGDPRADLRSEDDVARLLASELRAAGWRASARRQRCALFAERDGRRYAIEVKVARESRSAHLVALLADASLRARRAARELDSEPLAVVGAPRISGRVAEHVHAYAKLHLDGMAYGLIDGCGRIELVGGGLEGVAHREGMASRGHDQLRDANRFDAFSDLDQWLLKVLLAPRLPDELLHAPRERPHNATHLARLAGVSLPTAARFVARLKGRGFLRSTTEGLDLSRLPWLLGLWTPLYARAPLEHPARFALPRSDRRGQVLSMVRDHHHRRGEAVGERICIGLFAASELLGLPHARGIAPHVFHEHPSSRFFQAGGLVPASRGEEVDLFVVRPMFPATLFRAAVRRDGIPVSDVVQTWLDVSHHPARGAEHAAHLWKTVLERRLGGTDHERG